MKGSQEPRETLVTYGPTRAPIDAVRCICNLSTGRLGALTVRRLAMAGFRVHAIRGPGAASPRIPGPLKSLVRQTEVETVEDLVSASKAYLSETQPFAIVHAMAVLDYVPAVRLSGKAQSGKKDWLLRLQPTPKVVQILRRLAPDSILISFKLESGLSPEELRREALASMRKAGSDFVVANDLTRISGARHEAFILDCAGEVVRRTASKAGLAQCIADLLTEVKG